MLAVRAVVDLEMSQVDAAASYGVSPNAISQWVRLYHDQGEDGLRVQPQGRPMGSGRVLSPEQEEAIRRVVVDFTPSEQDLPWGTWTRQAVAALIARRLDIDMTLQGVGKYLCRWGLTPQKPARHSREQDPNEVDDFMSHTLPEAQKQAEEAGLGESTQTIRRPLSPGGFVVASSTAKRAASVISHLVLRAT